MKRLSIGEISHTVTKGTTPTSIGLQFSTHGVPFLRVNNIDSGHIDLSNVLFIDEEVHQALSRSKIRSKDLLISIAGTIGKTAIVPEELDDLNCNQALAIIRLKEFVLPEYLNYWFSSSDAIQQVSGSKVTGTIANLSLQCIKSLKVPVPPIAEQKRIAAILDKADAVRRKRREAIRLTEELLRSTFLEMFGDPITNPKGWDMKPIGNLCTVVRGGSPRPIESFLGGTVPWIKIGDATKGDDLYIEKTEEFIREEGVKNSRYLEPGSLIFANCGVSLGFARVLKIGGCIHDGWLALSDIDPSLNKFFLLRLINSITNHFRAIAPDGTQPNLNTSIIKSFKIPVPPLKLQEEFCAILFRQVSFNSKNLESLDSLENLFHSLLQRAFTGNL